MALDAADTVPGNGLTQEQQLIIAAQEGALVVAESGASKQEPRGSHMVRAWLPGGLHCCGHSAAQGGGAERSGCEHSGLTNRP